MTSGILLVDKPGGITSHDVVSRVRKLADTRKVGHAGTLDPMATGLLVLGINSSTRLLTYLVGLDKEYFATIRLGFATTTDDAEGEPVGPLTENVEFAPAQLAEAIVPLTGDIEQVPSSISAIKVDGKRSYVRVREGEEVVLKARSVTVRAFEVLEVRGAELDVRVECTSGTYIRALARDLGATLGVGGHLTALRRTRVGPFDVRDAGQLGDNLMQTLMSPASVAERLFTSVAIPESQVVGLSQGKKIAVEADDSVDPVAAVGPDGRLIGLVTVSNGTARVLVNFPTDEVIA
jgi:tRNA pseudouridine55 synthase